jgi:enediyne biosynthesis protein E4
LSSLASACLAAAALACADQRPAVDPPLFALVAPEASGVTFTNRLPDDTAFNILNYLYYYNGGGVAAGDVNNDGLPDLYFTSNMGSNRLYLNKGGYKFEDVTERAGVGDSVGWKSGVTMADVNGDGHLDIYVSGVNYLAMHGRNVLYLNNGDGTFSDKTRELGLEHVGYGTQAAFFDYDNDGDLDAYLLSSSVHSERGPSTSPQREPRHPRAGDRLLRNDRGRFVDVSQRAGIYGGVEGYGLGIVASDFDLDGCIDIYVANDFQENDFLYRNGCDGTFTESIAKSMGHTSRFSMGVDAGDFNNDGRPDVVVLDMLPDSEAIYRTAAHGESYALLDLKTRAGYHPQFARNTLQLNRGGGRFSEIGLLAGVYATDWSWSPLFADLDNDGRKDLFITNGIYRRPNDLDYINFVGNAAMQSSLERGVDRGTLAQLAAKMPQVPLASYAYRNNGDLTFTNLAAAWGLARPGFSNGAVYADLNNSGALDLVVNRLNAPAAIYRNRSRELNGRHYVKVRLRGSGANTSGIGAKVQVTAGGVTQLMEQMPTRGFQSSVEPLLHFGVDTATTIDLIEVTWPGGRFHTLRNVRADETVTFSQDSTGGLVRMLPPDSSSHLFSNATKYSYLDFVHRENRFSDFDREPLMPHMLSTEGPALAVGDVNGDSLSDVFVGGAKWQTSALFVQNRGGGFRVTGQPAFRADSLAEDVDAAFFDADQDGDQDLYVVSGGNEFSDQDDALRHRLYVNDGQGNFRRDTSALPPFFENGSSVVPGDFDRDGDPDLFVGGRVVSGKYGLAPKSRLLRNDGKGRFADVTAQLAPALSDVGMVTSAAWLDYDNDGSLDLVVVGEWMPVRVFAQENGRFVDRTSAAGLGGSDGWWNSVTVADVNGDGHTDLVLGNLGLNSYIKASREQPARLYVHDFGQNGILEQILTFYKHGVSYPFAGRDELLRLITPLRSKYPSYASFGASRIEDIFPASDLRRARVLEARTFATSVAINDGKGAFALRPLPAEAQVAPVYASLVDDFTGDGRADILLAGNLHGVPPARGRYDASYGVLLRGAGNGGFSAGTMDESGLAIQGQVRDLKAIRGARGEQWIVVARNADTLQLLRRLH